MSVEKTTADGVVQLFLNGELKLEQAEIDGYDFENGLTIGSYVYENWAQDDSGKWYQESVTRLDPDYDAAFVGKGATLINVNVSDDGQIVADEGGKISGINISGGTYSGSALCENASGWYGAGICLTASSEGKGAIILADAMFSKCAVNPLNGSTGHGGAIETYGGGVLSVHNTSFIENSASGVSAAGGAIAMVDFFGTADISKSVFENNTAYFGGAIQQNRGRMELTKTSFYRNKAAGTPTEDFTTENGGGALQIHQGAEATIDDCEFTENTAFRGGAIYNDTFNEQVSVVEIDGCEFLDNTAEAEGGAIYNYGVMTVSGSFFSGNKVISSGTETAQRGGAISNTVDGVMTISDCRFYSNKAKLGGAIWNDGVMTLENVSFEYDDDDYDDYDDSGDSPDPEDGDSPEPGIPDSGDEPDPEPEPENNTVYNSGSLTFRGSNDLFGTRIINEGSVTFCVSGDEYVVRTFGSIDSTGSYLIEISEEAASRAEGALFTLDMGLFTGSISVKMDETLSPDAFTFDWGSIRNDLAVVGNTALRFMENDFDDLVIKKIEMEKLKPVVSNDGSLVAWADEGYTGEYQVELTQEDDFSVAIRIDTNGTAFDIAYRSDWIYFCRVAEKDGEFGGAESCNATADSVPRQLVSNGNGRADVFFATIDGKDVWNALYRAKNTVTGETASITGRNRIRDTFTGSDSDANILYLSDTDNGDALFMDDMYSEFGEAARISLIREVRAGAGDDVVDMTSDKYSAELAGMIVRGGEGDDVLWGAAGGNQLFGDAGNDRITGGAGNDVIAGGEGDDVLAGGGGADIFTFGENWGSDVVSQAAGEGNSVTLWFESGDFSKWDEATLTYTDGENSVTVSGAADKIALKFGGAGDDAAQFAKLSDIGAFLGSTTQAVFETEENRSKGILASL